MAIFHLHAQILGKANGNSAVAAAAYRHCAQMDNARTGQSYDYSAKRGNVHSELALPDDPPAWAKAIETLPVQQASNAFWNAVELFEKRIDGQFAREMTLALPVELSQEQNIALVRDFVAENFTAKGIVADWAYHEASGNPHVHVMTALRPLSEDAFGSKNTPALDSDGIQIVTKSGSPKYRQFAGGPELIPALRSSWADVQNEHLARNGFDIRVDHRSYKDQGIGLDATMHRGPTADGMDRRGGESDRIGDNKTIEEMRRLQVMEDPSIVLRLITAQKAVFDERDVAKVVHRYTDNHADFQALFMRVGALEEQVMIAVPVIDPFTDEIVERAKYTTRDVLDTERKLIEDARHLASSAGFGSAEDGRHSVLASVEMENGFVFDDEQRNVIRALTDDRGIAVMVGYAGAGKSTVMGAVRAIYEAEGRQVHGAALAGKATVGLADSAGIASRTLASWEASWKADLRKLNRGDVFVIDEAGMVSSSQMQRFVEAVRTAEAKLIVLGDARQLQPIEYGAAFRAMSDNVGYCVLGGVRRQRLDYMREASLAFGSGRYADGLKPYIERGHVHLHSNAATAQQEMVETWFADWSAGGDILMLAHRNKDVFALNELARGQIKDAGGLRNEIDFKATRGSRRIAVGERIVFLEKSRDLGVQNGTFADVTGIEKGVISAMTSAGDQVRFTQSEYANIDYGYTATVHKTQGATVDRALVFGSSTMDAQLTYVALTRHRDDVQVFAGRDDFRDMNEFVSKLSRERLQSTTLAYEHTQDYKDSVREFAERRGVATVETLSEWWGAKVDAMRATLRSVAARFDKLRVFPQPRGMSTAHEKFVTGVRPTPSTGRGAPAAMSAEIPPLPTISIGVGQALARLDLRRDHVELVNTDRARKSWFTTISFELRSGSASTELSAFNREVRALLPAHTIMSIGPDREIAKGSPALERLAEEVRDFFVSNWPLIYSGQLAEIDQAKIDGARAVLSQAKEDGIVQDYDKRQSTFRIPEQPLIEAVAAWPQPVEVAVAEQITRSDLLVSGKADLVRLAAKVWVEPGAVVTSLVGELTSAAAGFDDKIRAIVDAPQSAGAVKGSRSLFGRDDADRAGALSSVQPFIAHIGYLRDRVGELRKDYQVAETGFRQKMAEPVAGLSPAALGFISRYIDAGAGALKGVLGHADEQQAYRELRRFVGAVRERFGLADGNGLDKGRLDATRQVAGPELETSLELYKSANQTVARVERSVAAQEQEHGYSHGQAIVRGRDNGLSL